MPAPRLPDDEFMRLFNEMGARSLAEHQGSNVRSVYARRRQLERRYDATIIAPTRQMATREYPDRFGFEVSTGVVLTITDTHYWPNRVSTSHKAFLKFCREMDPVAVILNGDILDGARISRHPRTLRNYTPSLAEELKVVGERLAEILDAAKGTKHFVWNLGNHDDRVEAYIANHAPELDGVKGTCLEDHYPEWKIVRSTYVNDNAVWKHRYKGGLNAARLNTMHSGRTIHTGHLHSGEVQAFSDLNGHRYGADIGCGADPYGDQFKYDEDNSKNKREGFCVTTFYRGLVLKPELPTVIAPGKVDFRGEVIDV